MKCLKCLDCIYYASRKLNGADAPCKELGILPSNSPCSHYMFDFKNVDLNLQRQEVLSLVHGAKNNNELDALIGMAEQEKRTRKYGLSIGDVFYIKLFRTNYISSYFRVVVLCADKNYVQVQGKHKRKIWFGEVLRDSLIEAKDYEKIKENLEKKGLVMDPNFDSYFKKSNDEIQMAEKRSKTRRPKNKEEDDRTDLEKMAERILARDDVFIHTSRKSKEYPDLPDIDEFDEETDDLLDVDSLDEVDD